MQYSKIYFTPAEQFPAFITSQVNPVIVPEAGSQALQDSVNNAAKTLNSVAEVTLNHVYCESNQEGRK